MSAMKPFKKRNWFQKITGVGFGFSLLRDLFNTAFREVNRDTVDKPEDFDYAAKLYQVSEQALKEKYLRFRVHGYLFFVIWLVFTSYVFYRILVLNQGLELTFILLDAIIALYSMRAFYFAYLIKNRTLNKSFFAWIVDWFR